MCKVDPITVNQARGRFARLCVEIDISKPLLGALHIEDRTVRTCREGMVEPILMDADCTGNNEIYVEKDTSPYGSWLLVSYGRDSGSRFDVLCEEDDITMTEVELQAVNKAASGSVNHKGKVVLTKITTYTEDEDLDSASVLIHLHGEVTDFIPQPVEHMEIAEGLVHKELITLMAYMDRSFAMMASNPEEALAVFLLFKDDLGLNNEYDKNEVIIAFLEQSASSTSQKVVIDQVAFVYGRQIQNNIVIAQEALHKFKTVKGKLGYIAWKIDLAKAYDKLQWGFIKQVIEEVGIVGNMNDLIMGCITNMSYKVVMNGELTKSFTPKCGIRQVIGMCGSFPLFFPSMLFLVLSISILINLNKMDTAMWGLSNNGDFFVKSAHEGHFRYDDHVPWKWNFIWKLKLPPIVLYFLWTLLHGKLLTNCHQATRGIISDITCLRCNESGEDVKHVFRGCSDSFGIWENISKCITRDCAFQADWDEWICINLKCNSLVLGRIPNYLLFGVTLWFMWK
ncbi:hypothetical protein Ddye_001692 [Dipteronia dyeriana]|uniref:Reverse transcriptase zinc-binding domain-containing protein n=1 Tax=Dipteronia dyeriana TaxID=168575 RepID=A0AAE0CU88_9ROSI|nr:hypothetical protein Ddye_001692 [Dipteronia dyeriana]